MRRTLIAISIAIGVGLFGAALGLSPLGVSFERTVGLGWLYAVRGPTLAPPDVVVVAIDSRTGDAIELPMLPRDWPRSIHARLVEKLKELGAAVIVFDIHFGSEKDPASDQELVDAVASAGNVVLVERLSGKRQPLVGADGHEIGTIWVEQLLPPFPALKSKAAGLATFPLPKEGASVDQFWVFKDSADGAPTMPAVALQLFKPDSIPALLATARASSNPADISVPDPDAALADAEVLKKLMIGLREIFVTRPDLGDIGPNPDTTLDRPRNYLQAMYTGDRHRLLNFYGPPGTVQTVPYQTVITGNYPSGVDAATLFAGKAVFVGYSDLYDPGQPDRFYTVFTGDDGVDLSGVEIAATAFGNLLTNNALSRLDPWWSLLTLFTFGAALGATLFLMPAYLGVPVALVVSIGYAVVAQHLFGANALAPPIATPLLVQAPLAIFIGLVSQYLLERRRGQRISEAINYYLPDEIARDLAQNRLDPDKLNQVVYSACLATDMAGFSTIAETLPPGELAAFLNEYFEALAGPLKDHGVHVTEFRADAIMCAWTNDKPAVEPRRQSLLAALDAADAIDEFKDRHDILRARLRIGIEVGHVFVGHAGGGGRFVYSIVGDSANTASRVEGLNKHVGTQILATGGVLEGCDEFLTRYLGDFQFVGKTEGIPIYEVMAIRARASEQDVELCAAFAEGLSVYHASQWAEAERLFDAILAQYADDGPSKFYRDRCQRFLSGTDAGGDPKLIRMESK